MSLNPQYESNTDSIAISLDTAAKLAGVSRKSLQRAISRGEPLGFFRIGGRCCVHLDTFKQWLTGLVREQQAEYKRTD